MASNSDSDPVVTYGVLGCANIARKVIKAIHYSKNSKLIAIASRDINKANKYCTDNNIPDDVIKYGSYADLLKNRDVHVVYVPLPTTQHCQWVIQAANAGKHILVEKPVAVNHREFEEMVNACNKNNVFIMDGTMFMHHDRLNVLKQYLSNHNPKFNCGTIKRINSSFSFPGDASFHESNIRVNADADPLGALGDLGWYSIRLGIVAYSASVGTAESQAPYSILKPHSCRCVCTTWSPDGKVPIEVEAVVYFDEAKSKVLTFNSSFCLPLRQWFEISCPSPSLTVGDKVISCIDFVLPYSPTETQLIVESTEPPAVRHDGDPLAPKVTHEVISTPRSCQAQQVQMITYMSNTVNSYRNHVQTVNQEERRYWQNVSIITQQVVDGCYQSLQSAGVEIEI